MKINNKEIALERKAWNNPWEEYLHSKDKGAKRTNNNF